MNNPLRNITSHPSSTLAGLATSAVQIAVTVGVPAAAQAFAQSGGNLDWRTYAVAAGSAALPAIVGALYAPKQQAAPPLSPLEAHRAGLLTKCDDAITAAAKAAMEAETAKLTLLRQAGSVSSPTPDSAP